MLYKTILHVNRQGGGTSIVASECEDERGEEVCVYLVHRGLVQPVWQCTLLQTGTLQT